MLTVQKSDAGMEKVRMVGKLSERLRSVGEACIISEDSYLAV